MNFPPSNQIPTRMSAKKFIAELDRRKILSDRLMAKLRDSVAEIRKPLSADALANFLVQKKLLSRDQANDVLAGLTQSGVNLTEEDADSVTGGNASESSSIFASHIISHPTTTSPPPAASEDDEIRLVPLEEDIEPDRPKSDVVIDERSSRCSAGNRRRKKQFRSAGELPPARSRKSSERLVPQVTAGGGIGRRRSSNLQHVPFQRAARQPCQPHRHSKRRRSAALPTRKRKRNPPRARSAGTRPSS